MSDGRHAWEAGIDDLTEHGAAVRIAEPAHRRTRPGRHLRPVDRPTPRRSAAVPVLVGTGIVIVALFGLAVMHALLIGGQIRLDGTQRAVAAETEEIRRLRLRVAELESPDRVLDVARARLGMVEAGEVGYLLPAGVDTGEEGLIRVEAAVAPDPEPAPIDGEDGTGADEETDVLSAEEREVADSVADDPVDETAGHAVDGEAVDGDGPAPGDEDGTEVGRVDRGDGE